MLRSPQIGDVAVLDVSATKIDKDESNVQNIPAAESKGLPLCSSSCFFFFFFPSLLYLVMLQFLSGTMPRIIV